MVRYKVAPQPRGVDALFAVRDALPLVPGSVEDCCTRIRDRTGVPSRDAAQEWLTFCQALGLAAETDRGYHRTREEPATPVLADRLLDAVFPARELREVLVANGPLSAGEAFDRVREDVPRWERSRSSEWESDWRERVDHLLGWFAVFGIAETGPDGYQLAK